MMVRQLPGFAVCWLGTAVLWKAVLVVEGTVELLPAALVLTLQIAVLTGAVALCRVDPAGPQVLPVLIGACALLGVGSTALFAAIGGNGDLLAFILLTLYLAASLFFAWGWLAEAVVLVATVIPWLVASRFFVFYVPTIELVTAIGIGSLLCLGMAERAARTFRIAFHHRANEQRIRRALEASRDAAEAATRAKDQFLATLSHELRAPLNAILTWTHMLRRGMLHREQADHALEVVERNARAQVRLIGDLLDVSRIVSGKLSLEVASLDVRGVVRAVVDAVRGAAEAKRIELAVELPSESIPVLGDTTRLHQVVENLVSNAIKFTPDGGRVEVTARSVEDRAEIVVRDTGMGVLPDVLTRIFERFHQADSSIVRQHGGLGLGLAIARHIVELHGGTITAESPGEHLGSTFRVRLPRDGEAGERQQSSSAPRRLDPLPTLAGLRVMVVDDEPDARQFVSTLLSACGAAVTSAASSAEALRALADRRPDVLVADLAMPEEDGYALIRKIRRLEGRGSHMRAIALTALATAEDQRRAMSAGFDLHLTKPVEPEDVVVAVAAARSEAAGRP